MAEGTTWKQSQLLVPSLPAHSWPRDSSDTLRSPANLAETKHHVIPATKFKFFTSTWQFLLHITHELVVGNASVMEGQTANILTSRTGLWAWCSMSLLEFEKYLSLLAETKRCVIQATKFFTSTWQFLWLYLKRNINLEKKVKKKTLTTRKGFTFSLFRMILYIFSPTKNELFGCYTHNYIKKQNITPGIHRIGCFHVDTSLS